MTSQQLWVKKDDLHQAELHDVALRPLDDGEVRLAVDRFALTANNVTYGAAGEMVGYWQFFPTDKDGWGIIPVWGYGDVVESKAEGIDVGARVYGYFPMGSDLIVKPERVTARGFKDGAAHRAQLPVVYNEYSFVNAGDATFEDLRPILAPLFATSYLIADFLADNDFYGAEQIIVCSASSKTAIGLALLLADNRDHGCKLVALTSPGNVGFVENLGVYDQVVAYGDIASKVENRPTVYVDMAGSGDVRNALHGHLGDDIKYACAVGITHWDKFGSEGELAGAKPVFFFAPSQIDKRRSDWGPGVVEKKIGETTKELARRCGDWLTIVRDNGADDVKRVYLEVVAGKVAPNEGRILSFKK